MIEEKMGRACLLKHPLYSSAMCRNTIIFVNPKNLSKNTTTRSRSRLTTRRSQTLEHPTTTYGCDVIGKDSLRENGHHSRRYVITKLSGITRYT